MPAAAAASLNPLRWYGGIERFRTPRRANPSYSASFLHHFVRRLSQPILHLKPQRAVSPIVLPLEGMAGGEAGFPVPSTAYEEALNCLSSLITRRTRADGSNKGDNFDLMFEYLKILELDEPITHLKVIHVAGTKGKGSTCAFTESILRRCGFRTGLFTSPHLIDIRERFRLDGMDISEDKFLSYFWWCYNRLQEKTDDDMPMPNYFRFLSLLAFKIFVAEQVHVAILEVGLGGKFDATNVVRTPIVCGISSLGYDHMEILGNTLGEIAGEKAGIFKQGVPAYTVTQPEEAMSVLKAKASQLGISLQVASPLDQGLLNGQKLGLDGEHQYINAGLAVAMSHTWLQKTGDAEGIFSENTKSSLPEQFIRGLASASLQGRAQIVPDPHFDMQSSSHGSGGLFFYLDGAHSPESMVECARWFSHAVKENACLVNLPEEQPNNDCSARVQILLFNCMPVRDPEMLLQPFINTCSDHGVLFHRAIFVPNQSVFNKVGSYATPQSDPKQVDLSWQLTIQRIWRNIINGKRGLADDSVYSIDEACEKGERSNTTGLENSTVLPSLPSAIKWLREYAKRNQSIRVQVLVTGSLHLIGDLLRFIQT
ncbi:folylpolyglutamate synthase isoform X2 [Dendrobium catenatum]|uniref:folylpolyglutamate synthase isoform X2 n=1 Tax=Dendrobium catenatum TaxID=906689 RepID=UPI0009F492F8|nr:folylpolyglutamate synthase isoform X2 [Dendrobium catenatum]